MFMYELNLMLQYLLQLTDAQSRIRSGRTIIRIPSTSEIQIVDTVVRIIHRSQLHKLLELLLASCSKRPPSKTWILSQAKCSWSV